MYCLDNYYCLCCKIQVIMIKKKLKQIIKAFDFFAQPITFRYGGETHYQSLTGGFCSLILLILFAIIFTNIVLDTLNKGQINALTTSIQEDNPSYYKVGTDSFMFAVGIQHINLNQGDKWFEIYFQKLYYDNQTKYKTRLQLVPCQREQWQKIKPQFGNLYDSLSFQQWLCPPAGTQLEIQGKFSSDVFKFYKIAVRQCDNQTSDRPCIDNANITQFLNENQNFNFNFYFINTILNPSSQEVVNYYLDDTNYLPFSPTNGISGNLFISTFNIETDQSILPYEYKTKTTGGVASTPAQMISYPVKSNDYVKFYLRKSSLTLNITRSFRKLDDTISYIGGLFSAILIALFIVSKYNEACYQFEVAKNLFHYDRNQPLKSDDFNFLIYLGSLIYSLFDKINVDLPWKKMQRYYRSLEEVRKQMDIRLVMKKILYSQRMAVAVFDQPKAQILHLQEPLTLKQAEQIRKDHRFYERMERRFFDYKKIRRQQNFITTNDNKDQLSKVSQLSHGSLIPQKEINNLQSKKLERQPQTFNQKKMQIYRHDLIAQNKQVFQKRINIYKDKHNKKQDKNQQTKQNLTEKQIKQIQFQNRIKNMKHYLHILQGEAEGGDVISKNILSRFDYKLIRELTEIQQRMRKDNQNNGNQVEKNSEHIYDLNQIINGVNIVSISSKNQLMGQLPHSHSHQLCSQNIKIQVQ